MNRETVATHADRPSPRTDATTLPHLPGLSARQLEIGNLVVNGMPTKAIAAALHLSPRTVQSHIAAIFAKFDVHSRFELMAACRVAAADGAGTTRTERSTNLPPLPTTPVGRDRDCAAIAAQLEAGSVVTVAGPGGIGKTLLALMVGTALVEQIPIDAWLVELAPLSRGSFVEEAIAQALGIAQSPDRPLRELLVARLQARRTVLILDNCEHVIEAVATTAHDLLRASPVLSILATSREPLRIAGERIYRLASLAVPNASDVRAAEAADSAAISLFAQRAHASDPDFRLTDTNAADIVEICRRLDGIPLAIELAAARVNVRSVRELREHLASSLGVLAGGRRAAPARHRTMRATLDWSFDLLASHEQQLFARLGIFVGPCTLEAIEAVCSDDSAHAPPVLDTLASLVDKSLVAADFDGAATRYRFAACTRDYAREKLAERAEREALAERHLAHFRDVFERAGAAYAQSLSHTIVTEMLPALPDARSALDWAVASGNAEAGAELFAATPLWHLWGLSPEELRLAQTFLALTEHRDHALRGRLWLRLANAAVIHGQGERAVEATQHAVAAARHTHDAQLLARTLARNGHFAAMRHDFAVAAQALDEAETLPSSLPATRFTVLEARGSLELLRGDLVAAESAFAQMSSLCRALGNRDGEALAIFQLAEIEHASGRTASAIARVREILPQTQALAQQSLFANLHISLAGYLAHINDIAAAQSTARTAIEILRNTDHPTLWIAAAIEHLALALALDGVFARAARLAGYSNAIFRAHRFTRAHTEQQTHARLTQLLSQRLALVDREQRYAQGAAMTRDEALFEALQTKAEVPVGG